MDRNVIVIDLDGTITVDDKKFSYDQKPENATITTALKKAKSYGYDITIATSRNMRTYQGDINKIKQFTQPIIENWLKVKEIPYDQLVVGKPWCGPAGFYVDDKNLHLDEFIFRFGSTYAEETISLVFFDNPSLHSGGWHKLTRLFNVTSIALVSDSTPDALHTGDHKINHFQNFTEFLASLDDKNTFYFFVSNTLDIDLYAALYTTLNKLNNLKAPANLKICFYHLLESNDSSIIKNNCVATLVNKQAALPLLQQAKSQADFLEKIPQIREAINLPFFQ